MSTTASHTTNSRRVPLDKRKRTETSCDKCKSRKQKCRKEPGQESCRYCIVHHIDCLTTQPRKKRLYGSVEGLGNRLALLESLVKGLLPEADVSNMDEMRQLGSSLGIPLPDSNTPADANGEQRNSSGNPNEAEETVSLLPDQQGQVQYIGPASSFSFHVKLRTLVGQGTVREFVLFGRNAADQEPIEGDADPHSLSTPSATSNIDVHSPVDHRASVSETPTLESLIGAFFDHINPDFPVLHEASFREAYEAWVLNPGQPDPSWLCSFLCVLLLARRVARVTFPEDQERLWWRRVQTLLPVVVFTSSVNAVQALMLAAIHLHNTNHRDACWNITGTAIRIAFAIGLHQDKVNTMQTPLARELRKRLWWTLYAFEQMQVSSYDRPSAIEHLNSRIGCPNERIIGMAGYCPPDYCKWFNRLVIHLGSACRAPKNTQPNTSEESYVGPLSPAAAVLRDLDRWRDGLPSHLRAENADTSPPSFQRPLLLLHAMYHYTVVVLCRAALLTRATSLSKQNRDSQNSALTAMADACTVSGRSLARLLLKLDSIGKFDPVTWWDIWYALTSGSILVLDLVCANKREGGNGGGGNRDGDRDESRLLLERLAEVARRAGRNGMVPGTIGKWASIVVEMYAMADAMRTQSQSSASSSSALTKVETRPEMGAQRSSNHSQQDMASSYNYHQSSTNSGAYMFADNMPGRFFPDTDFGAGGGGGTIGGNVSGSSGGGGSGGGGGVPYSDQRVGGMGTVDRNTQLNFMDFTINNIQDWNWGDLGSLLGNGNGGHHGG